MKRETFQIYGIITILALCLSLALWHVAGSQEATNTVDVWRDGMYRAYWNGESETAKFGSIAGIYRMRNVEGSTVYQGRPVEINGTAITVVTEAAATATHTIADSLSGESGLFWLSCKADPDTAGDLVITGTDPDGTSQTENVTYTVSASSNTIIASNLWKTVTAVNSSALVTTDGVGVEIKAYPHMAFDYVDATTDTCFGVIVDSESNAAAMLRLGYRSSGSIADNGYGWIASGYVGPVKIAVNHSGGNAAVIPGDKLNLLADGHWDKDSAAKDSLQSAIAISPGASSTSTLVWAFIRP